MVLKILGDLLFGWLIPETPEPKLQGTELTKAATDNYIPKIYGKVKKHTGTIIFKSTNDDDNDDIKNDLFHLVIVWSEAVHSIDTVYVDDIDIESNNSLFVADNGTRYAYARSFPNGMAGYDDPILRAAGWRPSDICENKACTYIRLEYGSGENLLRSEPEFTADITGTTYTNNVTALSDYLRASKYGKALDSNLLNLTGQASVCDTVTTNPDGSTRPLFSINTAIDTSNTVLENTNTILKSMRALLPVSNGKLRLVVEKDDPPVSLDIVEQDIIKIAPVTNSNKSNRYNRVVVSYNDADANSTSQDAVYPPKDSDEEALWLEQDNNILLEKSIKLDTCDNYFEALAFAKSFAQISREQLSTSITMPLWATLYEVGDIVNVTHSLLGFESKPFRIIATTENDSQVTLKVREHQPYVYDPSNTGTKPSYPDTTNIITRPASVTGLTATAVYSSIAQYRVSWSSNTTRHEVAIVNSDLELVFFDDNVSTKYIDIRNLPFDTYSVGIKAINTIGMKSSVETVPMVIDQVINSFIWRVYTDDTSGLNPSLTDTSKPFIALLLNQSEELTDLTQVTDFSLFTFIAVSAAGFLSGDTDPTADLGTEGATYLNNLTKELFKKVGGVWVTKGFLSGNSIVWKGASSTPPSDPEINWVYRDTDDGIVYIWDGASWEVMSQDGQRGQDGQNGIDGSNGVNGQDGTSITWLGSFNTFPSGATDGNAFYHTINKRSYVRFDGTWYQMSVDGQDGSDGSDGQDGVDGVPIVWKGASATPPSNPQVNWVYRDTDNGIVYIWDGSSWEVMSQDGQRGIDGSNGVNGEDGTSIRWLGTFGSFPSSASNGDAFYHSNNRRSYVRFDNTWYQMTVDGQDGQDGQDGVDGLPIVWKGASATPPSNPQVNWVYRDTDNGIVYIWDGSSWEVMSQDGQRGIDGSNGVNGQDGTSIRWLGTFGSFPSSASNGDAFYHNNQNRSYVRYDGTWYQMTVDGEDGSNGQDGLPIVWKGTSSSPPSSPQVNWAYRDSDNGRAYVWTGSAWALMVEDGQDGRDGQDGADSPDAYSDEESKSGFTSTTNWQDIVEVTVPSGLGTFTITAVGNISGYAEINNTGEPVETNSRVEVKIINKVTRSTISGSHKYFPSSSGWSKGNYGTYTYSNGGAGAATYLLQARIQKQFSSASVEFGWNMSLKSRRN
ncbi:hypothetical protein [Glaciecola sp. KUL10]|uniref:hypothetical protein n=1 Tax=Glaciecola sp. (strain KUL10) TaxID=2161813 RepID=UPI000D787B0D|nr:hypothetical protein [Glaciecola sp. KUL10]GBL02926.1 OmpA/MotB domain protein [Glaciecola sp. KUL10]